jgi:uncharacterized phage protein (TIGR02220 family)
MFAKTIIDSDAFLDMPLSSQCLYFHLSMRADDEGFINNPRKIQRMIGSSEDDLKLLIAKKFIIPFESGVCVIKHWRIHNYIQNDRFKETMYLEEKSMLLIKQNKAYTVNSNAEKMQCIQDGYSLDAQVRLGKDSLELDKDKLELDIPFREIIDHLNQVCGTNYKHTTEGHKKHIRARWNEKYTLDDFKMVIDKKATEWINTEQAKFLRPETLFGNKFDGYLNQLASNKPSNKPKSQLDMIKNLLGEDDGAETNIKDTSTIDTSFS